MHKINKRGALTKGILLFAIVLFPLFLINAKNASAGNGCCVDWHAVGFGPCVDGVWEVVYNCDQFTHEGEKDGVPCAIQDFPVEWTGMEACGGGGGGVQQGRVLGRITTSDLRFFTKAGATNCNPSDMQSNSLKVNSGNAESGWECNHDADTNREAPFYKITTNTGMNTFTLTPPEGFACGRWTVGYPTDSAKNTQGTGCTAAIDVLQGDFNTHLWFFPEKMLSCSQLTLSKTTGISGEELTVSYQCNSDFADVYWIKKSDFDAGNGKYNFIGGSSPSATLKWNTARAIGNILVVVIPYDTKWKDAYTRQDPNRGKIGNACFPSSSGNFLGGENAGLQCTTKTQEVSLVSPDFISCSKLDVSKTSDISPGEELTISFECNADFADVYVSKKGNFDAGTPDWQFVGGSDAPRSATIKWNTSRMSTGDFVLGIIPFNQKWKDAYTRQDPNRGKIGSACFPARDGGVLGGEIPGSCLTQFRDVNMLAPGTKGALDGWLIWDKNENGIWDIDSDEIIKNAPSLLTINGQKFPFCPQNHVSPNTGKIFAGEMVVLSGRSDCTNPDALPANVDVVAAGPHQITVGAPAGFVPENAFYGDQSTFRGNPNAPSNAKAGSVLGNSIVVENVDISASKTTHINFLFKKIQAGVPSCSKFDVSKTRDIKPGDQITIRFECSNADFADVYVSKKGNFDAGTPDWQFVGGSNAPQSAQITWNTELMSGGDFVLGIIPYDQKWRAAYERQDPNRGKIGSACFPARDGGVLGGEIPGSCLTQFRDVNVIFPSCSQLSVDKTNAVIQGETIKVTYSANSQFADLWLSSLSAWNADQPDKWKKFIGGFPSVSAGSATVDFDTTSVAPGTYIIGGIPFNQRWREAFQPESPDFANRGKLGNACFPTVNGGILGGETQIACSNQCVKQIEIVAAVPPVAPQNGALDGWLVWDKNENGVWDLNTDEIIKNAASLLTVNGQKFPFCPQNHPSSNPNIIFTGEMFVLSGRNDCSNPDVLPANVDVVAAGPYQITVGSPAGFVPENAFYGDQSTFRGNPNAPSNAKAGSVLGNSIVVENVDITGGKTTHINFLFRKVVVQIVNNPPVLDPIGNKQVNENSLLQFTISGSDPDNNPLTFSASNLPSGASFDPATKTFSWTPTFDQAGTYQVTFTVSDGSLTDSETITITVGNVNRGPALSGNVNPLSGNIQTLFTYTATYSDADNNAPAFVRVIIDGISNLMQKVNPSDNNFIDGALFSFSTMLGRTPHNFTFEASDGTVTVATPLVNGPSVSNVPPVIVSSPPTIFQEADPYNFESVFFYDVEATDFENDPITFSLDVKPDGMSIDSATGLIAWKPNANQLTTSNVVVRASDPFSFTTQSFSITVVLPPEINVPRRQVYISTFSLLAEDVQPGGFLPVAVSVENTGLYHLEEASLKVSVPELSIRKKIGPFQLKAKDEFSTIIYLEIPEDAKPGTYDLRLSVNDLGVLRERYREFKIIE